MINQLLRDELTVFTSYFTPRFLVTARNGAIQRTFIASRVCSVYGGAYTAAVYSIQPIHYTALYAHPLLALCEHVLASVEKSGVLMLSSCEFI